MTITLSAILWSVVGAILVIVAGAIFMHARANVGTSKEREELAKAHRIVMELAKVYNSPNNLQKAERLDELRLMVAEYYNDAV